MSDWVLPLLVVLVVLATGVAVYFARKVQAARTAAWAGFARRHGLSAHGLRIEGTYQGLPLTVDLQTRGAGRNQTTVTVLRLSVGEALPPDFSLEREGLGDKVLRLFGKHDPEIGDARFDEAFDLRNLSPATAEVLRRPRVQQHLFAVGRAYQDFHLRGGWLQAEGHRVPVSPEELEAFIAPALQLAQTLQGR